MVGEFGPAGGIRFGRSVLADALRRALGRLRSGVSALGATAHQRGAGCGRATRPRRVRIARRLAIAQAVVVSTMLSAVGPSAMVPSGVVRHRPPVRSGLIPLPDRYMTDLSGGQLAKRYGYNLIDVGPSRDAIDALPAGTRALVWVGNYSRATCTFMVTDAALRSALGDVGHDPKVAGYYIADEADDGLPAYGGHCPNVVAQITARSELVRLLAPGAFTYEVVTEPGNFAAFAKATDVMGADPYPCLRGDPCDWSKIPSYIAALERAHVAHYWGVLQTFAYHQWRFPTAAELTRMINQWRRSEWEGEQTFAWHYNGQSLAQRPDLLAVLNNFNHAG